MPLQRQARPKRCSLSLGLLLFVAAASACSVEPAVDPAGKALISLGARIFNDPALSRDGTLSCASCHRSDHAFADPNPTSRGTGGVTGTRNAPSLLDVETSSSFFWDGRETRLESVVLQPFTNRVEMGQPDLHPILQRVRTSEAYRVDRRAVSGDRNMTEADLAAALTAFLRSLSGSPTRLDDYLRTGDARHLTADELEGLSLFKGKAGCGDCHSLAGTQAALTDNAFHHSGVGFELVAGDITRMTAQLRQIEEQGQPIGQVILADRRIAELGRFSVTRKPQDLGAFRTPSLRNIARTAPYMHDGSVSTLQDAIEREIYYRSLAKGRPISLTVPEQQKLLAFMQALSTQ